MINVTGKFSAVIYGLFFTALLTGSQTVSGKVYRIVDEETGKITFTDKPPAAQITSQQPEKVDLPETNTQPAVELPPKQDTTLAPADNPFPGYSNFVIGLPRDQSTIPPGFESIDVQLSIAPQLQDGHRVQLNFNSKKYGNPSASSSFSIGNLIRGAHNISADILDDKGNVVASTPTITVFVKRGSRNF